MNLTKEINKNWICIVPDCKKPATDLKEKNGNAYGLCDEHTPEDFWNSKGDA